MSNAKPAAKNTFTVEEMQIELDASHLAQEHCRSLWGAARGRGDWRMTHDGFIAGYKAKNDALQSRIEALEKDAARWHLIARYLVGDETFMDDEIVNAETVDDLVAVIDAAKERA